MVMDHIKGRDIIVIGLQPWYYDIGSNCKDIATRLSLHNRVLYVNGPINRKTFYASEKNAGIQKHCDIIKNGGKRLRPIKDNMWEYYPATIIESINWLPSTNAFKIINRLNNTRFAKDIREAIRELNFRDYIIFNDNDIYNGFFMKELLKPELYIYYCRDFLQGYSYWKKHCSVLEPQLIKKADLVTTNSTYYAEYCAQFNKNSYYIGQGCNLDLFDVTRERQVPADIQGISSPTIGYVGALDSARLDERIIELIAKANNTWNVVLIGPPDALFSNSKLHELPNVHFLGRRPLQELPNYIKGFDVCINPQLSNIITKGNYPLKIDEYLAMGKPVVATRTRTMKLFEDYTYLADKPEDYPALIEQAIRENNPSRQEERIAFARTHTWENSLMHLYQAIDKHLKKAS